MGSSSPSPVADPALAQSYYYYYVSWSVILSIGLAIFRRFANAQSPSSPSSASPLVVSSEFKRFQRLYLIIYLIMMAADWLQGPYVYALYEHYGYSIGDIGILFIVGFGSSLLFGTVVGSAADKYGRKKLCILFGILYSASCITKHFHNFSTLLVGRLLGGISTSILFSSFESWMVSEHHKHSYPEEWLGHTFSLATWGNGLVAIFSGILASFVRDRWGPVAPFDTSLIFLSLGTMIIALNWQENTGDSSIQLSATLKNAFDRLRGDRKIMYLGVIQSFFEGAMYIFVFMWSPTLQSSLPPGIHLPHGFVFASFMICVLIGSTVFQYALSRSVRVEKLAFYMLSTAAVSLSIPAFANHNTVRLLSFFLFECCVGMFWPSIGFMRSRYIPEDIRATTMNLFRIPLNFIVCIVLVNINSLTQFEVFAWCFMTLLPALYCQYKLNQIVLDSPESVRKMDETHDTEAVELLSNSNGH